MNIRNKLISIISSVLVLNLLFTGCSGVVDKVVSSRGVIDYEEQLSTEAGKNPVFPRSQRRKYSREQCKGRHHFRYRSGIFAGIRGRACTYTKAADVYSKTISLHESDQAF